MGNHRRALLRRRAARRRSAIRAGAELHRRLEEHYRTPIAPHLTVAQDGTFTQVVPLERGNIINLDIEYDHLLDGHLYQHKLTGDYVIDDISGIQLKLYEYYTGEPAGPSITKLGPPSRLRKRGLVRLQWQRSTRRRGGYTWYGTVERQHGQRLLRRTAVLPAQLARRGWNWVSSRAQQRGADRKG